jgi:phospholipase C
MTRRFVGLRRRHLLPAVAWVVTVALSLSALSISAAAADGSLANAVTPPCGFLAGSYAASSPPAYDKVVVIMEENLSYAHWSASAQAMYTHSLARQCGSEANFYAATHPSQPNYMATASGYATGVGAMTNKENVFHQLQAAGRTWRNYAESMPTACADPTTSVPRYKRGHTPAYWYTDLRSPMNYCAKYDVPMTPALDGDVAGNGLPAFAWVTPNACNDYHWDRFCPYPQDRRIAVGEQWLQRLIPRLVATPSYQHGRTLIVITFDEGDGTGKSGIDCTSAANAARPDCKISTIVLSAFVVPGAVDRTKLSLFSLGGTVADVLGLRRVGRMIGAGSLRPGLRF